MRHSLSDTVMPILTLALDAGEAVFSQSAAMLWMEDGIEMTTNSRKGIFGTLKPPSGWEPFTVEYKARVPASLAFAPRVAGRLSAVELDAADVLICRREVLVCATRPMEAKAIWQERLSQSPDRCEIVMLRLAGPGTVFLAFAGEVVERELRRGERLRVPIDHVALLEPTVAIAIERVPGFRNALAEANGLDLATLTGPGRVTLQSMPLMNIAEEICRMLPHHPD